MGIKIVDHRLVSVLYAVFASFAYLVLLFFGYKLHLDLVVLIVVPTFVLVIFSEVYLLKDKLLI
jgi:hypothetical protein